MQHFCTYFDRHYLLRGLTLYRSLESHCPSFQLWVLCMDDVCHDTLSAMDLPNVRLISLADLEGSYGELLEAKKNRSLIEYYFTCTPALPLYILDSFPGVDAVTYLDADLFFFADPAPLFDEIGDHSIAIIAHRFPPELSDHKIHGIYNVGFIYFRRDGAGLASLRRWLGQCVEWCYDRVEGGRFADQRYLDEWPGLFQELIVLQHKGANLAPWNVSNYRITRRGGRVWVDEQPLIFFHFHGLKRIGNWVYEPNLLAYKVKPSRTLLKSVYKPYIKNMLNVARENAHLAQLFRGGGIRYQDTTSPTSSESLTPRRSNRLLGELKWRADLCRRVYKRSYILVFSGYFV